MFLRQTSCHGRRMGEVRSAQQKCTRRMDLDGLSLLQLEHLLTAPDYSKAAMDRLTIIAAEDVGAGSPDLVRVLAELTRGWKDLGREERARRLLQAAAAACQHPMSRFVPHWAILLVVGVEVSGGPWRGREELVEALRRACEDRDRDAIGLAAEEALLRTTWRGEDALPEGVGLEAGVMDDVWDVLVAQSLPERKPMVRAWRAQFGPRSRWGVSSRLFLYLAVVDLVYAPEVPAVEPPEVGDDEVDAWLERAGEEAFAIPDWMYDKHTRRGRMAGQGQAQFFEEATALASRSEALGAQLEDEMRARSAATYLELERRHGRASRTAHVRARWRDEVARRCA